MWGIMKTKCENFRSRKSSDNVVCFQVNEGESSRRLSKKNPLTKLLESLITVWADFEFPANLNFQWASFISFDYFHSLKIATSASVQVDFTVCELIGGMDQLLSSLESSSLGGGVKKLDGTLNVYLSEISSPTRLWIQEADVNELDRLRNDMQ